MDAKELHKLNQLTFTTASIQVSPQEVAQLNARPPVLYEPTSLKGSSQYSGYYVFLTGYAAYVLQQSMGSIYFGGLTSELDRLRAQPRPQNGLVKKGSVDTWMLKNSASHVIQYRIISGQILVYNIELKENIQFGLNRQEKPALYHVKRNAQGNWRVTGKVTEVRTSFAAVNGQSNNLQKAQWLMGEHLDFEYGKSDVVNEFTLYHNPSDGPGWKDTWESAQDKMGFTTDVTKQFAKTLQTAKLANQEVKWVAHSQGGIIFAEAVRYTLNNNSSWAILGGFNGVFRSDKGKILDNHSVAFHGNGNNNLRSKVLLDRAGIKTVATRGHDYDLVYNIVGLNTVNPWKFLGSAVYSPHVMNGSVQQSPHTMMHKNLEDWERKMESGNGKGRNTLQKGFHAVDSTARITIKRIENYLK